MVGVPIPYPAAAGTIASRAYIGDREGRGKSQRGKPYGRIAVECPSRIRGGSHRISHRHYQADPVRSVIRAGRVVIRWYDGGGTVPDRAIHPEARLPDISEQKLHRHTDILLRLNRLFVRRQRLTGGRQHRKPGGDDGRGHHGADHELDERHSVLTAPNISLRNHECVLSSAPHSGDTVVVKTTCLGRATLLSPAAPVQDTVTVTGY